MSVINPVVSQTVRPVTQPTTRPPGNKGGGPRNPPIARDLVAWWNMDGTGSSGETESLGSYDLTTGGPGTMSASTTVFRTGGVSRLWPGGSSAYLRYAGVAPADLCPQGDFTFSIWARPLDTTTRDVAGVWNEANNERCWRITHTSSGWQVQVSSDGTAGTITTLAETSGGAANTWYLVTVTRKGNTLSLYVNDNAAVTTAITGVFAATLAGTEFRLIALVSSANALFDGQVDACGMWNGRAIKGRDVREIYNNGAGVDYAALGQDVSGYASYAAAIASGDNWKNGEYVRCISSNGVVDFRYWSALAGDGYNGLIHRFPINNGTEYTPTLLESQGATDPDSWTGWTDNPSAGTNGADYEYVASGGRAILRDIGSGSSGFGLDSPDLTSDTNTDAFWIYPDLSAVFDASVPGTGSASVDLSMATYLDASNLYVPKIAHWKATSNTNWMFRNAAGFQDSGLTPGTERTVWCYVIGSSVAYWVDGGLTPTVSGTAPSVADSGRKRTQLRDLASGAAEGNLTEISLSGVLYGYFS